MLTRRFYVGDLLAITTGTYDASPRGILGVLTLLRYMTRYAAFPVEDDAQLTRALRAAILATYPELAAYVAADVPPPELLPAWRKRREREFGRYLPAPQLPPTHPLFTEPATHRAFAGDGSTDRRDVDVANIRGDSDEDLADAAAAPTPALALPPAAMHATAPRLRRRFHVGDLLAVTTGRPDVARRGVVGTTALMEYLADRPLTAFEVDAYGPEVRAALLAAYPELGAYTEADVPPRELLPLWLRRREREFGRYLAAPRLPPAHPLHVRSGQAP